MASSSSTTRKNDVFLNFRGTDTRHGFTSYLYEALRLVEINAFIDKKLERGEEISPALLQEIESSSISVVIFSQDYASSPYCLDELVKIIECKESIGQSVFPVFYKVDPTDIEELRGRYGEAFAEHEAKFKGEDDRLEKWKSALQKTINISGWTIKDDKDAPERISSIVLKISEKLNEEKRETLKRKLQELQAIEDNISSHIEPISSKRQKNEFEYWLTNVGRMKEEARSMHEELEKSEWTHQFGGRVKRMIEEVRKLIDKKGSLERALVTDASQTNHEAFLTKRLVGQEFQSNMDLILKWLYMDEVASIGIYGMGGVGKTTLVTHIHNKILENPSKFGPVYWVTMSKDFSVKRLQSLIAKTINIHFGKEKDERRRAATLSKELNKRHKFVLIVDDLWNPFDVIEVGIPIERNGCKLIVTTRSNEVCRRTDCQRVVNIEPLNEEETWDLFMKTCGCNLPSNVEGIARECDGLPLAIVTMAGSMKRVDDLRVWKNALTELENAISRKEDMGEGVFRILRYSYKCLNDLALQQCFLYCALFPEDQELEKQQLITYLIAEGIIDHEMDTMQAKYDKGYTMLNKLENVSLLERVGDECVKMHDLMRDMAIQIIKEYEPSIIEAGKGLEYVPDEKYWRKDIVRVSLVENLIDEIPPNFSPSCPHLSTLLLSFNEPLLSIADSFFDHLQGLKVLDLSHTRIEKLSESVAGLKNLTALFLRNSKVSYIPTLANLKSMEWLDLSGCYGIKRVPAGLESLSNLRHLNLLASDIEKFPTGILPKLTHLQFLAFDWPSENGEELGGMQRLETLIWRFPTVGDLGTFLVSEMARKQMTYNLLVDQTSDDDFIYLDEPRDEDRAVTLFGGTILGELREVQIGFLSLIEVSFENGIGLCSHLPMGLKKLEIEDCTGVEYLFNLSNSPRIFQNLEELDVSKVDNLNVLFVDREMMVPRPPNSTLSFCLKVLDISYCPVKKLLPHGLLASLQNLQEIKVRKCIELEEMISEEENSHTFPLSLPNLRKLKLAFLPKLKRICSEEIKCEHLQSIFINQCKELKNVPISLPLSYLQSVEAYPTKWWESVKWGQPHQKDALPYKPRPT